MSVGSTSGGAEVRHFNVKLPCNDATLPKVVSERVQEHLEEDQLLVEMLEQEKGELDAQLHACKRRQLNELSKRVAVRVKEAMKVAVMERLVEDVMYS